MIVEPLSWITKNLDYENFEYKLEWDNSPLSYSIDAITAAHNAINYICTHFPSPYTLCISGGVDSQAMLYAWHTSGKPYKIFSARYNYNLNDFDLITLDQFCKKNNIPINYYDFDLFTFLETEHDAYANKYYCGSPHFTTYMKFADIINEGTVLYSGNYLIPHSNLPLVSYNGLGLLHYATLSGRSVIPYFLCETRELAYSFTKDIEFPKNQYIEKYARYQSNGFPVIPQDDKFNGFEKVKEWYDTNYKGKITPRDKIVRRIGQVSNRNFDILYRNKYEAKFAKHKYNCITTYVPGTQYVRQISK